VKNVLLFTQIYPPRQGGAATFYSNLVRANQNEINFSVISEYHSTENMVDQCDGATIYRILPKVGWLPRFIQAPLEALILLIITAYLAIAGDIDIIHSHASRGSIVGLATAATIFNLPIIYDCRDTGFRPQVVKIGPTPVWFSCASNIDQLLIDNGVPEDRILRLSVVNPNYVREYRHTQVPERRNEIIFIGSIVERKGIFSLLSAVEIIRERGVDVHLTVIGDGPAASEFDEKCRQKEFGDHVTRLGRLDHNETLHHLSDADILVLPSESEGVPRVLLEGQDVGTPVVATSVGGISDVIAHEENGMLTKQTPKSIAENVLRLVHNDELYRTIVENGIETADKRNWERIGKQLCEGYSRVTRDERRIF